MSLLSPAKATSSADGREAFETYKARKDESGSNNDGNQPDVIPSEISSLSAAIFDTQTCFGGKVPTILTDILDLASGQSGSAANHLAELQSEKNRAVSHVSNVGSEQVEWIAKVLSLKEQVGEFHADKKTMRTELVAKGAECDKLNSELILRKTKAERLRARLEAKAI